MKLGVLLILSAPILGCEHGHVAPSPVHALAGSASSIVTPDETAWILTGRDFSERTVAAFAWNEWERLMLGTVGDDPRSIARIRAVWDHHYPIAISVDGHYSYGAIRHSDGCVVRGDEPEFEHVTVIAESFDEAIRVLARRDAAIRWCDAGTSSP